MGTDVIGPMARKIADLDLLFDSLRGPKLAPLHDVPDTLNDIGWDLRGLRVAWAMQPDGSDTSGEVMDALERLRIIMQEAGALVEESEPDLAGIHSAQAKLRSFGLLTKHGKKMNEQPELYSDELKASLARGESLTAEDLVEATRACDRAVHSITEFFGSYDIMIWPTSTKMPFRADAKADEIGEDWKPLELTPVLQVPALAIPVGTTPDEMPCGVQLIGPKRSDPALIQLARKLEPMIGFVEAGRSDA